MNLSVRLVSLHFGLLAFAGAAPTLPTISRPSAPSPSAPSPSAPSPSAPVAVPVLVPSPTKNPTIPTLQNPTSDEEPDIIVRPTSGTNDGSEVILNPSEPYIPIPPTPTTLTSPRPTSKNDSPTTLRCNSYTHINNGKDGGNFLRQKVSCSGIGSRCVTYIARNAQGIESAVGDCVKFADVFELFDYNSTTACGSIENMFATERVNETFITCSSCSSKRDCNQVVLYENAKSSSRATSFWLVFIWTIATIMFLRTF